MKQNSFSKKRIIHIYIIAFIVAMIIIISILLMFKYYVEGEKNLPFKLRKINVISTAESLVNENQEGKWYADILQKNDIMFIIEKNNNYKKDETIKRIIFENFRILKANDDMVVTIYRPATSINEYIYSDKYKIDDYLEYDGRLNTNVGVLEINNQGGVIGFGITAGNIGNYNFEENEKLPSDGRLLTKANIGLAEIKFEIFFDMIIETDGGNKFKSTISLELPVGNIVKNGVGIYEDNNLQNVIFKRFK